MTRDLIVFQVWLVPDGKQKPTDRVVQRLFGRIDSGYFKFNHLKSQRSSCQ